jgi:PIN domain nuclease of toxin-antitoxin system
LTKSRANAGLSIADITRNEIAFLVTKRRSIIGTPLKGYLRFFESMCTVLPITALITDRSTRFDDSYPIDPTDRLIGATAIIHGLSLVTKDQPIHASKEVTTVW